jgi:hypothetical protein
MKNWLVRLKKNNIEVVDDTSILELSMPFTFSHPAIVLLFYPLQRWFSISALVVGSLTPDFEYFIRMRMHGKYGHTLSGIIWFDLPLALLIYWIYHKIIRDPLISSLPQLLQRKLQIYQYQKIKFSDRRDFLILITSFLIGISSHVLWDSFTHQNGYFVQHIDFLQSSMLISGFEFPVYKLLQHGSSFLGALVIIMVFIQLPQETLYEKVKHRYKVKFWGTFLFIS